MEKEAPTKEPPTEVENIRKGAPSIDEIEGTEVESRESESQRRRGRPPKDIETIKRVPITVSLSPKLISEIADRADEQDISRSELVNNAVAFDFKMHDRTGKEAYFLFTDEEDFRQFVKWTLDEYDRRSAKATKGKSAKSEHSEKPTSKDGVSEEKEADRSELEADDAKDAESNEMEGRDDSDGELKEDDTEVPTPFGL